MADKRRVQLETAVNTRDLGGYNTHNGTKTSAVFLRSDYFKQMSDKDQDALTHLGVRTVIDLRGKPETERIPSVFIKNSVVEYTHMPIFEIESPSEDADREPAKPFDMGEFYISVVKNHSDRLLGILRKMAAVTEGKIMYHCSAGKDRTGIISAILLGIAGVEKQTIISDYALTERMLADHLDDVRKGAGISADRPQELIEALLAAKPESMKKLLDHFDESYGGIPGYLETIGLKSEEISLLRGKMTLTDD